MSNLVINRFRLKISEEHPSVNFSATDQLFFRKDAAFLKRKLTNEAPTEFLDTLNASIVSTEDSPQIYYDFRPTANSQHATKINVNNVSFIKRAFIKHWLIDTFRSKGYIIEPFPTGADLAIYKRQAPHNSEWDIYFRYDITTFPYDNEISVAIASTETLISRSKSVIHNSEENVKAIDAKDNLIKRVKFIEHGGSGYYIANADIRRRIGIKNKPVKIFYERYYKLITEVYTDLLNSTDLRIRFESGGFKSVHPADVAQVDFDKNQMLFGNNVTDVNAATGMRDGGPFEIPKPRAEQIKFMFIYQNREDANKLFTYLKKGLKHYPGLLSYVGVSVNIADERLIYTSENNLPIEFEAFINTTLVEDTYPNHFALVILPFSRESADEVENELYYSIKEKLLKKGIASQLVDTRKIKSDNFHYHLPNISIAILAKIGGVPWKLLRKPYNELIVGFNEETYGDNSILATAVYFDNSGKLRQVKSFHGNNRNDLIVALRNSIQQFLEENSNVPPERLVIHYFKPPRQTDMERIDNLIRDEFRFNLPFALVEINDTKVNSDICFDVDFKYGMPTSGVFVKLRRTGSEYLLFNNQRYWKDPMKRITAEEYPIKVKLYNTDTGGFNHKELLSQVYEFSRLYWKGLKQRSQPVTTQYSKMVADFATHFEDGNIPNNIISQQTAWFI